jgi:hypothetical protein
VEPYGERQVKTTYYSFQSSIPGWKCHRMLLWQKWGRGKLS